MKKVFVGIAMAGSIAITGIIAASVWQEEKLSISKGEDTPVLENIQASNLQEKVNPLNLESKQDVQERLLNSYHFFDKAKGSFVYTSTNNGMSVQVDYKLKWTDKKIQYNAKISDKASDAGHEIGYSEGEFTTIDHGTKVFEKFKWDITDKGEFKRIEDVYVKHSDGTMEYVYPNTSLNLGMAEKSLHAKEIAVGFLENQDLWKISGTELLLGREVVVIEGAFDEYYQDKLGSTYTLWMDQNTGILLKYETYGEKGQVITSLKTTEFKVSEDFEVENLAKKIPANYKKMEPVQQNNYGNNS
ncbi:hypothetical protein AM500_05160 [Bacillus sp. FJAT-18017]|uniref:sigma-E factor regulatory protein RseB domain-containing protein n=1 Tax=Bacillus sp. FJAT-18017 TaxID=1705566 RepID=UPI0006AE0825|nr:sigma-E factor regulatory protein RseB domain-containing protein [Bacillus sp. FJAT-18017]ALC89239.1 hypothetical protein AM500_05160 [Bacillus sp. FJAT-18017]